MSDASDVAVEGMVTMQERIVNLINQLNMPLIEVSLVVGRHIAGLSRSLDAHIETTGQVFNERITTPWPIEEGTEGDVSATFDLEKIFKIIDEDHETSDGPDNGQSDKRGDQQGDTPLS